MTHNPVLGTQRKAAWSLHTLKQQKLDYPQVHHSMAYHSINVTMSDPDRPREIPGVKHKVIGLVSGGKDSTFNLLHCVANGHELVALATLTPEPGVGMCLGLVLMMSEGMSMRLTRLSR